MSTFALALEIGTTLRGRFRLEEKLKDGQGISTWRSWDLTGRQPAVVKAAPLSEISAPELLEHEAQVLSKLGCPTLGTLLSAGRCDRYFYLAYRFVEGESLERRLSRGPMTVEQSMDLAIDLFSALGTAHSVGILHRDVKPANIIVGKEEVAVLIDFGLARSSQLSKDLQDLPSGTPATMAPEVCGTLRRPVGPSSDLFSAGVVLFQTLTGTLPYPTDSLNEMLRAQLEGPRDLSQLRPDCPRNLEKLIYRLLRAEPEERYQTAKGVLADLKILRESQYQAPTVLGSQDLRANLTRPSLVGRDSEVRDFDQILHQTFSGQSRKLVISAVSGGGKSRLLEELSRRATLGGAWVLRGQGSPVEALPLQLLQGVAQSVVRTAALDEKLAQRLRVTLAPWKHPLTTALPVLTNLLGASVTTIGPESLGSLHMSQALEHFLAALGTQDKPAVVLLDDAQWADVLSTELISRWPLTEDGHTLVVIAFRPEDVGPNHPLLSLDQMRLRPLERSALDALLHSAAGPLPTAAREFIRQRCQGQPFLALELLQGMVEAGDLRLDENGWSMAGGENSQPSIRAGTLLAQRLSQISVEIEKVLGAAAVVGRFFDTESVAGLVNLPLAQVSQALEQARARQLIWLTSDQRRHAFSHDKVREGVLQLLKPEEIREFHNLRASQLDKDLDPFALAYHLDAAGEPEKARPYAMRAARLARSRYTLDIAESYFRMAIRAHPDYEAMMGLGVILAFRGFYEEAMKCYEWALERTDKPWEVESRLSELLYFQHRTKEASARTMRALRALKVPLARTHLGQLFHAAVLGIRRFLGKKPVPEGTLEILAEKLRLLDNRAELEFMASSPPGVILEAHMNTIVIAEHAPDLPVSGRAFLTHAVMCFMVGQRQRSNEYFQRALDLPSLQSDSYELGRAYNRIGGVHFWLGEIPEAETALQEAHQRLLPAAEPVELGKNINLLCSVYYLQGRFREMEQMARGACEKYRSLDDDLLIGMVVPVWALATGGQVPESFLHPTRRLDGFVLSKYGEAAGYVRLRQRRWEEASSHFLHTINRPWASTMDVALCRCWLVTTYRQAVETLPVRDGASRSRYLKLARGQLRKMISGAKRFSYLLPHAYRESGLVAALEGRNKDALSYLQRSLREADRLKTPFEAAWSRLELAKMLVAWGEEGAEAKLGQAYGELKAMGATWLLPAAAGPDTSPALHDRFEQVVRWGGQVVLRETPHQVYRDLHQASATLLRGQRSSLFLLEDPPRRLFGEAGFSKSLLSHALESGHPSSGSQNQPDSLSASLLMAGHRWALCAPITTDGKAVAFLYVTHDEVAFSSQEEKLAEYLVSLAGAALDGLRAARQRRKALEALRLSEDRFAALFYSAGVGLALVDGEDHILELNPRLEEMLGSQLVGRSFAELLYHGDRRPERARLEGLIAGRVDS